MMIGIKTVQNEKNTKNTGEHLGLAVVGELEWLRDDWEAKRITITFESS